MAKGELETAQGAVRASEGRLRYEQVLLAQLALCAHLCKMCEGQKYLREWLTQDESQLVACSACQATGVDPKTSQEANADWVRPL